MKEFPSLRLRPGRMRALRSTITLAAGIAWGMAALLSAAPYPPEGLPIEWVQPDGTKLVLKVFGDEFYARTTTKDGFTVKFDEADQTYYYAVVGPDGRSLVPSKAAAHHAPPANLPTGLEDAREIVAAIREQNVHRFAPDRSANWNARAKAVEMQRVREASRRLP